MSSRLFKHQMAVNNRIPITPHLLTAYGDLYSFSDKTDSFLKLPSLNLSSYGNITTGARNTETSPDGRYVALCSGASGDAFVVLKRTKGGYVKVPLPTTHSQAMRACWSPDGKHLFSVGASALQWYRLNANGTFTLMSSLPSPPSSPRSVAVSKDGTYLAVSHDSVGYVTIYKLNLAEGSALKLPPLSVPPDRYAFDLIFLENALLVVTTGSTRSYFWRMDASTDTFTPDSNSGLDTEAAYNIAATKDLKYVAVAHPSGVNYYRYNSASYTFTKLSSFLGGGNSRGVKFSESGRYLAISYYGSPWIKMYRRDGEAATLIYIPAHTGLGNYDSVEDIAFVEPSTF